MLDKAVSWARRKWLLLRGLGLVKMGCRFAERTTDEGDNVARIGEKSEMGGMAMMKNWEGRLLWV